MTEQTKKESGLIARVAKRFHVDESKMLNTLKQTAFRQKDDQVISNEQMMALMVVADQHKLNPFTKEIYAFPDKGGIIPIVGVDGWARIINEHPEFDGMEFKQSENLIENAEHKTCPEWIECVMYRKDRSHPISTREYLDEVYRPPMGKNKYAGPWQSHTKRFLRHKAMIQTARLAFSFAGIYDPDEAERIIEAEVITDNPKSDTKEPVRIIGEGNVTPPQIALIKKDLEANEMSVAAFEEGFSGGAIDSLPADCVNEALQWIKKGGDT